MVKQIKRFMYITSSDQLKTFCESLQSSDVLAVDTEFVRERTYFHRIGLIQVGGKAGFAAIDPIILNDLTPLLEILKDPKKINPLSTVDLVIDHSVMVDTYASKDSFKKNVEKEFLKL